MLSRDPGFGRPGLLHVATLMKETDDKHAQAGVSENDRARKGRTEETGESGGGRYIMGFALDSSQCN